MSPKHWEERQALIKLCWACAPGTGAGRRHWRRSPLKVAMTEQRGCARGSRGRSPSIPGVCSSQGFVHPILQRGIPWHPGAGHSWGRCSCLGGTGVDGGETISKEPFTAGRAVAVTGSQNKGEALSDSKSWILDGSAEKIPLFLPHLPVHGLEKWLQRKGSTCCT